MNIWQTVALLLVAVGGVALWEISARLVVRAFRDADWTEWFKRRMARKERPVSDENVERCAGVLLSAIRDLMSESRGVVGLHKNGDVAPWDEIDVEGRYSEWLGDAMGALHDALAHARASRPREAAGAPEACPRCPACGATEWFNVYSYKSTDGQGHPLKVWTDSAGDGDRAECRDKWHVEEREIEGIVERTIQKIPAMLAQPASAAGREGAREVGAHAMEVAERCFYAIKGGKPYGESIRAIAAIIEAERPLLAAEAAKRGEVGE